MCLWRSYISWDFSTQLIILLFELKSGVGSDQKKLSGLRLIWIMQQSSWGAPLSCCWDSKQHDITSEIWFIVVVAVRLPVSLTQFFTFVQWHMKSEKKSSNDDDDGEHSQLLVVQLVRVQIAMRRYRVYSAISWTMNGGNWEPSHHRHSRMRKKDGIFVAWHCSSWWWFLHGKE